MFRIALRISINRLNCMFVRNDTKQLRQLVHSSKLSYFEKDERFSMPIPYVARILSSESFLKPRVFEVTQQRRKSSRRHKSNDIKEYDSDKEDSDSETEDAFDLHQDDMDLPSNYKDIQIQVQSLRADSVLARSLNVSRTVTDEAFLSSKLRFNDDTLKKKSKLVNVEDSLELVVSVHDGVETFRRIRILQVDEQKTSKEKYKVKVRAWRGKNTREVEETWRPRTER